MVRLLRVTVFEGAGLAVHKEPYVCAELLDITGRPIKHERAKTSAAPYGPTVVWDNRGTVSTPGSSVTGGSTVADTKDDVSDGGTTLTLGRKHDLRNVGALPVLRLSVWGRELISKDKPLGVALVDLASLPEDGRAVVDWRPLEPVIGMDEDTRCGSLYVSISLDAAESNRIFSAGAAGPEGEGQGYVVGVEDGPGYEEEEFALLEPNLLVVRVRRAKDLKGLDVNITGDGFTSDPFVKIVCDGVEFRTKVVPNSLSPQWEETFEFAVKEHSRRLELTVMDSDLVVDEIVGFLPIRLEDLLHKKRVTRWFRLLDAEEMHDEESPMGELELSLQWIHDPRSKEIAKKNMSLLEIVQRTLGLYDGSSDTDEGDMDDDASADKKGGNKKNKNKGLSKSAKRKLEEKKRQEAAAEKKALQDELMDIEVKSGDYTIYVHIIEARELKAEDVQGTSDPVVYVEAFGQKFATEVKQSCLSCVFDETFVIGLRNLDKDVFEEGVIRVCVMDADGPVAVKNDLIGSYSFDAANVYFHKDHEIHRQWVALVDDENPRDSGTQGYLQLSIAVVGPGDKLKVHDEQEDRRKEREAEAKAGGIDGLVMVPPSVTTKIQWLVTTVWKAEYLPVMDTGPIGRHGGDFYAAVSVSGGAAARTKSKTMYGVRAAMCPIWRTQLWVPASIPYMSGSVKTVVRDWDPVGDDETVASVNVKLKEIEALPDRKHKPRWFPLYGAPVTVPSVTELAEIALRITARNTTTNWRSMYENLPQKASTYRGRILLSREIRDELPHGRDEVARLSKKREPSTSRFAMRCYVSTGADIPQSPSVIRMGQNFKMTVRISIGSEVLETRAVENLNGVCEWGELLESLDPIVLPSDTDQMPDLIVHLLRGDDRLPICFYRIPAKELLERGMARISPQWLLLQEDKVLDSLPAGQFPGSVLIKVALGTLREFSETAAEWQSEALGLRQRTSYLLRVHIYQGRDLPPADSNGLLDPYLKLQCLGEKLNTETFMYLGKAVHRRRTTVDPMWYFTWEADLSMPPMELQRYFPQVSIQLMDFDAMGVDDYAGCLFLNLGECPIERDQDDIPLPPEPKWTEFFLEKHGDSTGELLVSYQLVKTTRPGLALAPPPDLSPKLRPAHLEVLALGIRGMQPFEMFPMQMPYMELEVDLPHGRKVSLTTNASKKPTGADANFLERLTVPLELPVKDIFAPRLKLRVRDVRLGGFLTPVVAVGAVDLASKLPWSSKYECHSSRRIGAMEIMEATGAPVYENMFDDDQGQREEAKHDPAPPPGAGNAAGARTSGGEGHAGGVVPFTWSGTSTSGAEIRTANPMNAAAGGGTGGGAVVAPAPVDGAGGVGVMGVGSDGDMAVPEKEIIEIMGQEDEGAGVFGAILHEPVVREKVRTAARVATGSKGLNLDEDDGPPKYMIGRETTEAELERDLETKPFETYHLYRGQKFGSEESGGDYREVGRFKCVIRVTIGNPDDEPMFAPGDKKRNEEILNELLIPKGYKMRLYVLQALNLTPMDLGMGGRPGKSDPYLRVKLGKEIFNDQDNYIDDVTDADLYKCVELNCELPGASQLRVDVMDYDDIGSDELIGRTVIDLEDRWFDQRWQDLGTANRVEDVTDPSKMRWQTKPVENRSLYVPTSNAPQGILQCWVDVMPAGDAKAFIPEDVALPPEAEFEVRLVIWKCKDVVSMDFLSGLNDLYVKAWLEGCEPQETDTHWRAKGGKGSFNWRMKFKVKLGPRARTSKFPYLTLQMWDKDLLKWNDCIAEGMIDLGRHFRRAYKKKTDVLKLFESVQTERAQEAIIKTQQALKAEQAKALKVELETGIVNQLLGDPGLDDGNAPLSPSSSFSADAEVGWARPSDPSPEARRKKIGGWCCGCGGKTPMTALELREENDRRRTKGMPLLSEDEGLTRKEAKRKRKEEGDEEMKELLQKFKVMAGLSTDDPPDTQWIKLEKTDRKSGKKQPMGQCLIGLQIYPVEKAEVQPAGTGRAEPNDSPFLPPPNGRLEFGWNPISMISQLLGPRLCCALCACLCCALLILSVIFLQPLWNLIIAVTFN